LRAHGTADLVNEIDRAGDVSVEHVTRVVEVLVKERLAKAAAGIGKQRIDAAAVIGDCRTAALV